MQHTCSQQQFLTKMSDLAENGFVGMGIGAAMTGLRPIIEGMNMGFLLLAYNQISNNAGMLHYTSGGQFKVCLCTYGTAPAWLLCDIKHTVHASMNASRSQLLNNSLLPVDQQKWP